ncbi:MAG: single-stranded-DNA-specific exonuclease RecJ [Candidatus Limnocylindrus sp.]
MVSPAPASDRIIAKRRWHLETAEREAVEALRQALVANEVLEELRDPLAELLAIRGLLAPESVQRFLDPHDRTLHAPELLPDAAGLIARLRAAGEAAEPVLVVGDFDADGLTGAAIMIRALRAIGAVAEGYIPNRESDGHGIPEGALLTAQEDGVELLLAVDCGTADRARVAEALDLGILVGIIDHHAVPSDPAKAAWLVNPNRPDANYPFPNLAGSGLAFKIAQGILADHKERRALLGELSVLAMIGGVADMVPIADEFRVIVRSALKVLNGVGRIPAGVQALLTSAGAEGPHRVEAVGFTLAPRINAAGRIGDARVARDLLTTDDQDEAMELSAPLEALNHQRREISRDALQAARAALGADGLTKRVDSRARIEPALVAVSGPWSAGVLGLVAGRLAEEFGRPALVASLTEPAMGASILRCSIRAPRGFSVAKALEGSSARFIRHGGHDGAGGCTAANGEWDGIITDLAAAFAGQSAQREPVLSVDLEPASGRRSPQSLVTLVDYLSPTGVGNPDPLFLFSGVKLTSVRLVGDGKHARLTLEIDGSHTEAIAFSRADALGHEGSTIDVVGRIVRRTYRGAERIELHVVDLQTTEVAE